MPVKSPANDETIFYDYKVWGDEDHDNVTVRLQYRLDDENGTPVGLDTPGTVSLDGERLEADSARFTGPFYEVNKPLSSFAGRHHILLTAPDRKLYQEDFSFVPFTLATEIPEKLKKQAFQLKLTGLPSSATKIQLVMVDTSFASPDVNEELWLENGELNIEPSLLDNLSKGPVTVEITREEERPLTHTPKNGGRILFTYRLRRQFEFVD